MKKLAVITVITVIMTSACGGGGSLLDGTYVCDDEWMKLTIIFSGKKMTTSADGTDWDETVFELIVEQKEKGISSGIIKFAIQGMQIERQFELEGNKLTLDGIQVFMKQNAAPQQASSSRSSGGGDGKIIMKVKTSNIVFWLNAKGEVTIDWGDGKRETDFFGLHKATEHYYEKESVQTITITGKDINYLKCSDLISLDVSKCSTLENLECDGVVTNWDGGGNPALVYEYSGQLTSLDVSKCTVLKYLSCGGNKLTKLDVSKNTVLDVLSCGGNKLTNLDVSKNTALVTLNCTGNQITSLDVSKNTELRELRCPGNQLTASALNALFMTLIDNSGEDILGKRRAIYIRNNPGEKDCDKSIAVKKNWLFDL